MNLYNKPTSCVLISLFALFIGVLCHPVEAYIEGPWLWMLTKGANIHSDYLAVTSQGALTEQSITEYGINEHTPVGQLRWTRGHIRPTVDCLFWIVGCYSNNVNEVVNRIGLSRNPNLDYHTVYALINVVSRRTQRNVQMGVGSDDAVKVWLNGDVVHINNVDRGTTGIQDTFRVDLNAGNNLLLVKVSDNQENWGMFFEIYLDTATFTTTLPTRSSPLPTVYPRVSLATQMFDRYGKTFQKPRIQTALPKILEWLEAPENRNHLTPELVETLVDHPELLRTFGMDRESVDYIKDTPEIRYFFKDPDFQTLIHDESALAEFTALVQGAGTQNEQKPEDVNGDGIVNIQDLTFISTHFGKTGQHRADVNGDGVVDIRDLVQVASVLTAETTGT